jgi:hypothetical protein
VRHASARDSRFAEEPALPADLLRLRHPLAFANVRARKRQESICPMARIIVEWSFLR